MTLFQKYIQAALHKAKYKIDKEKNVYIAFVEELPICWGQGATYEDARQELANVIEGWVLLGIQQGDTIPPIGGINLESILHPKNQVQYA